MRTSKNTTPPAKDPKNRAALPWWKKSLFALLTTLAFFLLLEGVLWLAGVEIITAGRDPYVGFADNLPLFVPETDADGPIWMTTAANKREWFNVQRFPREKAPGTRRVFCLGGSTTYGRPYDDTTSFSAWLRELLPSATAETRWEVINAGGISYASYRVAALMEELTPYQPDLFVVYTGHNEFLEERAPTAISNASPRPCSKPPPYWAEAAPIVYCRGSFMMSQSVRRTGRSCRAK